MSESLHGQSTGEQLRPGQTLRMKSLAPRFKKKRHQLYFDLLMRAIGADGNRNIALTGAYGTGKSSILHHLREGDTGKRVVEISLSTILPEVHDTGSEDDRRAIGIESRTNRIQKEIVKQLLYRLPPNAVPQSRFRRADLPNKRRDRWLAVASGGAAFAILFGLGLLPLLVEALLPDLWRQIVAYVLLLCVAVVAGGAVISLIRARPTMSASVQAGGTAVTLSNRSDSYFDEYLDEIVYFFQASRRDIVVIEDIDRFEDVQVFDTLRALNGLLNSSGQIGRRVVFVYAIRDSVFEQIGENPKNKDADEKPGTTVDRAKEALERASRTKFFDVIIPVVPFVSADNARDVMSKALKSSEFTINPALIRLAARHVADMRLIDNIRNEFEVYRSRLIVPNGRVPGITDDLVFAIVLYKNTHLADFEKIRYRDSRLDRLYSIWRDLVGTEIAAHTEKLTALRRAHRSEAEASARANQLGQSLSRLRDTLTQAAEAASSQTTLELSGPATDDNLYEPDTWAEIAAGENQEILLRSRVGSTTSEIQLSFTPEQLAEVLGARVDAAEWETEDLRAVEEAIAREEADIDFLRHRTWNDLCDRDDFTVDITPYILKNETGDILTGQLTFDKAVDAVLESDLARDLVRHGFLTTHFALYSASYYGTHLGPNAMEYIRRCIEPGIPDSLFPISTKEVTQLLREQNADKNNDAEFFHDASVFNLSIVDYLLSNRPAAAATVAHRLARLGEQEREFLDLYVAQGDDPGRLLTAMVPHWSGVLQYVAVEASIDPDLRRSLIDAVLHAPPHGQFDTDQAVGRVLESCYRDLTAICQPGSAEEAETALNVLRSSGARLDSLAPLNEHALKVAVDLQLYRISAENYRVLVPEGPIALDVLKETPRAYTYALSQLDKFLALADRGDEGIVSVASPTNFAEVINDVAKHTTIELLNEFIDSSNSVFRVDNLSDVSPTAWPRLAASARTSASFRNVASYVDNYGVDASLSKLLSKQKKITEVPSASQSERRGIAVAVLAAGSAIPSTYTRVGLAASVRPGALDASTIAPESGDLIARLIKRRLIADDATTFTKTLMVDWPTLEATVLASKKFAIFVSPQLVSASDLPRLILIPGISIQIIKAMLPNLTSYLSGASRAQVQAVANALIAGGWRLVYATLETLRSAGATPRQIIILMAKRGDDLTDDQIKALLTALGGRYAQVASGGRGRPNFDHDTFHEYVLNRLLGRTVRRVEPKVFKGRGPRHVAHLL